MNFFFLIRGKEKLGSNRIYINNYSKWIAELGYEVNISKQIKPGFDVYILSKYSTLEDVLSIKKLPGKKLIGLIHPTDLNKKSTTMIQKSDFLIVGSIEEKDYFLNFHKNVFRLPQLEDINTIQKNHQNKESITIGYHGNLEHLEEMHGSCTKAIEKLGIERKIKLLAIYDLSLGKWKKGRPNNIEIIDKDWTNLEDLVKNLKQVDIGIVPGTNNFFLDKKNSKKSFFSFLFRLLSGGKNKRLNDYIIRFKATSNAGRAFVFHQLGIPVVADFWPSHFEILGNSNSGMLAHSENGWYNSLNELINSYELRQEISKNAFNYFKINYSNKIWTENFINQIKKL